MMKKAMKKMRSRLGRTERLAAVLIVTAMFLATGCGGGEKVLDGSVQNLQSSSAAASGADESGTAAGQGGEADGKGAAGGSALKGYLFTAGSVTIAVDAEAGPLVEQLGSPVSYFSAASCAFEGLDKMYTYNGFELDTYPQGDKDYVSSVILKDDSVTTAEGIAIGDSLAKLQKAYPDGGTAEGGMLVYEKEGMKLCFILENEEIISIEYRSTVLDQ